MPRQDLREVVLVEEDDLPTGDGDVATRGPGAPADGFGKGSRPGSPGEDAGDAADGVGHRVGRLRRGRPGRAPIGRRGLVALGTLAVVVATTGVVHGARERADAARLAGVKGLLSPLAPEVRELWRHPAGWGQMATIGGDLVVGRFDAAGEDELVGVDAATGRELWVAPIPELTQTGEIWCETFGDAERHLTTHVACRVIGAQGRQVLGRRVDARSDAAALLVVIDTRTGARVVERTLDGRYPTMESMGEDLVLVELDDDAHVLVTRLDPVTGEERWTFRSPEPLPAGGRRRETPVPRLEHDVLLVTGETGWALSPDGELLGEWDLRGTRPPVVPGLPAPAGLTVLPDGRFAVAQAGGVREDRFGRVSATDDGAGFTIPGPVVEPAVDDGSASDVLLTSLRIGGELVAQDATTGERLWTFEAGVRGDVLLLDRRVLAVGDDAVVALDVRTGDLLWSAPLEGRRAPRLMTDGRVVVAGVRGTDDDRALVAWGVEDGRERWRAPLPPDATALREVGGRLVAFSDDDVIGLGLPGERDGAPEDEVGGDRGNDRGERPEPPPST